MRGKSHPLLVTVQKPTMLICVHKQADLHISLQPSQTHEPLSLRIMSALVSQAGTKTKKARGDTTAITSLTGNSQPSSVVPQKTTVEEDRYSTLFGHFEPSKYASVDLSSVTPEMRARLEALLKR